MGVSGKKLVTFLQSQGFVIKRICGSHHFLVHEDGRKTTVPVHAGEEIGPGLLNKIVKKDLGFSKREFYTLFKK